MENETFESTAILPSNLSTGVQDADAERSRNTVTRVNKTGHLSVKSNSVMS